MDAAHTVLQVSTVNSTQFSDRFIHTWVKWAPNKKAHEFSMMGPFKSVLENGCLLYKKVS